MVSILSVITVKSSTVLGAAMGAIVSLKFAPGKRWWQRATNTVCGAIVAVMGAPFVVKAFSMDGSLEYGFAFLIGMFGMNIAAAFVDALPVMTKAFINKFVR